MTATQRAVVDDLGNINIHGRSALEIVWKVKDADGNFLNISASDMFFEVATKVRVELTAGEDNYSRKLTLTRTQIATLPLNQPLAYALHDETPSSPATIWNGLITAYGFRTAPSGAAAVDPGVTSWSGATVTVQQGESVPTVVVTHIGATGNDGWAPVLSVASDGAVRKVLQVTSWIGGEGTAPSTGYVAAGGVVANIADADDLISSASIDAITTEGSDQVAAVAAQGVTSVAAVVTQQNTSTAAVSTQQGTSVAAVAAQGVTSVAAVATQQATSVAAVSAQELLSVAAVVTQETTSVANVSATPGSTEYASTANALSKGVWSVAVTAGGSGGTTGTYYWTTTGGAGADAAGYLTVAGGAITGVYVTHRGQGYTSAPTIVIAGSHNVTGHTLTPAISQNQVAGTYFIVKVTDGFAVYVVDSGGTTATLQETYPSYSYVSGIETDVESLLDRFDADPQVNLFSPDLVANAANNGYLVGSGGGGGLAASARYMAMQVPVTAGQTYTFSIYEGETGFVLNNSNFVNFYNSMTLSAGTKISTSAPGTNGVAFSDSNRTVTFTAPTGAVSAAVNAYASDTGSPTAAQFQGVRDGVMFNTGGTRLQYQAYVEPNTLAYPEEALNPTGPVEVLIASPLLYVVQPCLNNTAKRTVRRIAINTTPSTTDNGVIDFTGAYLVGATYDTEIITRAINSGDQIWANVDNNCPVKFNNMYQGGNHGVSGHHLLTVTGHGLTATDVGDVGTSGGKSWVLVGITDANTLSVVPANTGASVTSWTISGSLAATGTMVFAGAGSKAWTAATSVQLRPAIHSLTHEMLIDDKTAISDDGVYSGQSFTIRERYTIPNPAEWLATLISEKGTATPKALSNTANAAQVVVDRSFRFDRYGSMVVYDQTYAAEGFAMSSTDYLGGWQHNSIIKSGHTLWQYVPDLSGTVGGYDLKGLADISSNNATVTVPVSASSDVANPPSHFAQVTKLSGTPVYGLAMGYIRTKGAGVPATRATNTNVFELSTAEKMYPRSYDVGALGSTVTAGAVKATAIWEAAYPLAGNTTHTVDVTYEDAGKVFRVIDIHATVSFHTVPMASDLVGLPLTVISKSSSLTLHTDQFVPSSGLLVSTTGGWGRLIVQVG